MKTIITNLINSRKHRIGFHCSYLLYPNKINTYELFSKITDAHIKLPQVDPSHSRSKNIYQISIPPILSKYPNITIIFSCFLQSKCYALFLTM